MVTTVDRITPHSEVEWAEEVAADAWISQSRVLPIVSGEEVAMIVEEAEAEATTTDHQKAQGINNSFFAYEYSIYKHFFKF